MSAIPATVNTAPATRFRVLPPNAKKASNHALSVRPVSVSILSPDSASAAKMSDVLKPRIVMMMAIAQMPTYVLGIRVAEIMFACLGTVQIRRRN